MPIERGIVTGAKPDPSTDASSFFNEPIREQMKRFVDEHRGMVLDDAPPPVGDSEHNSPAPPEHSI